MNVAAKKSGWPGRRPQEFERWAERQLKEQFGHELVSPHFHGPAEWGGDQTDYLPSITGSKLNRTAPSGKVSLRASTDTYIKLANPFFGHSGRAH